MSRTLGINLGSNVTTVYQEGRGIVAREPNAVAVDTFPGYKRDGEIISFLRKFDETE